LTRFWHTRIIVQKTCQESFHGTNILTLVNCDSRAAEQGMMMEIASQTLIMSSQRNVQYVEIENRF
jgi:hypothetical protein